MRSLVIVEPEVLAQVGDEPVAVGVVTEQGVLGVDHQRVHRAGAVGTHA